MVYNFRSTLTSQFFIKLHKSKGLVLYIFLYGKIVPLDLDEMDDTEALVRKCRQSPSSRRSWLISKHLRRTLEHLLLQQQKLMGP